MKSHLFNHLPEQLCAHVQTLGETLSLPEARRVLAHVVGHGNTDFKLQKKPIRVSLQNFLEQHFSLNTLKIIERVVDPVDRSVRYLFESHDGALIEAVRINLLKPNHYSVCLSSQVGCAMACDFCATGRLGFKRNLEPWEIISQFWQIKNETEGKLSGAVFMGQGEPFHNYDNVIQAAKILSSPTGLKIDAKNITISTVGLVPQIKRFTEEAHKFKLIVSLTTAIATKRQHMLPVAHGYPLEDLALAIKNYAIKTKERITLAWVLIQNFNTGSDEVEALQKLFCDIPFKLNLIDVNDNRVNGYQRATEEERKNFLAQLQILKVPVVRRYSVGNASDSACGMLASKRSKA